MYVRGGGCCVKITLGELPPAAPFHPAVIGHYSAFISSHRHSLDGLASNL